VTDGGSCVIWNCVKITNGLEKCGLTYNALGYRVAAGAAI
jgi:hypothetical protein